VNLEDKALDVIADVDPFPVKPGGMIDTHRKAEAARQAAEAEQRHAAEDISNRAYKAVKVAVEPPEAGATRTVTVSTASGIVPIVGADMLRRRVIITTLDEPIVLAADLASASDTNNAAVGTAGATVNASGAIIPIGVPYPLEARCEWFAVPTSATPTRVSIIVDSYAPAG
jgi:hypothetical protein